MVRDDRDSPEDEDNDAVDKEEENAPEDRYLSAKQVRRRYGGKSDMTLWRWMRDLKIGFPTPAFTIKGHRFWRESDLQAWERGLR